MHFWFLFVHPKRDPPRGGGLHGSIRLAPDQTDRRSRLPRVFSGLRPEARHTPRRPCGLPHGLGGGDPSPCAPPRQAGKPGPFEHSVEGFCGAARVERAWSIWTKNRSGRALTCVSFPPSQRRAPFRGIHKGGFPLMCAFYLAFCTSKKQAVRPDGTGHPLPLAAHFSKKVRYSTAVHPPPSSGGIQGCKSALSMSACLGARGFLRGVAP